MHQHSYPHSFTNDDSKGNKLTFPKDCPANDDSRYEFPLKNGSPYDGGKNNVKQGDERVVFYYEDGEISYDGNPQVYYCGIMTHKGAPSGGFLLC
ncbi:guanyl-specific ribonuclease f1 [Pyrenophora tritici-repentis]|nr:guanyl-specific ribonuclease f1 [Pyrenophora tritici-repentis]